VAVVDVSTEAKLLCLPVEVRLHPRQIQGTLATEKSAGAARGRRPGRQRIQTKCIMATKEPSQLPWKDLGVGLSSSPPDFSPIRKRPRGTLRQAPKGHHLRAGKGEVKTLLIGVNDNEYDPKSTTSFPTPSCTTNCLAPVCTSS